MSERFDQDDKLIGRLNDAAYLTAYNPFNPDVTFACTDAAKELTRLRALVAVKNGALRVFADRESWDSSLDGTQRFWIRIGIPRAIAQAALDKE